MRTQSASAPAPAPAIVPSEQEMESTHSSETSAKPMLSVVDDVEIVRNALANTEYDWRSANLISQETHIRQSRVEAILEDDLGDIVVRSFDSDFPDQYLYTTRERYERTRGGWNILLSVVCDRIR